jgi:hypothetical protein
LDVREREGIERRNKVTEELQNYYSSADDVFSLVTEMRIILSRTRAPIVHVRR